MTKIYTSYFANLKNLPSDVVPISVCLYPPSWYDGIVFKKLAPSQQLLNRFKSKDVNIKDIEEYFKQINQYKQSDIVKELFSLSNNKSIALVCYEKPLDFCHRHFIAKWLNDEGYDVQELEKEY